MTCTGGRGLRWGAGRAMMQASPIKKWRLVNVADKIVFTRGVPPPEAFPTEELGDCFDAAVRENPGVVLQYTEQPSYDRAIKTFRRRGARAVGIPLEEDGISVERLEAALGREVPAFLYLVPDFQNPAGATLSLDKRQRVVELANEFGFNVIEDVPYRKLRYSGEDLPLLREIDPSRVITMSSFSKLLSPGIRVGFMISPPDLSGAVTRLGEDTYLSPVLPTQAAVAEYLRRGLLEPNVERLKQLYTPRWK